MNAKYDTEVDVLKINCSESEGVILDYDPEGNVIGIEILNASKKIKNFVLISNSKIKA